ncbi:MAG: M20 family metallopeptidase [Chloroflexi bacterium]|nr:M20 family metallopeptidase [Chloroflexota bacterium]
MSSAGRGGYPVAMLHESLTADESHEAVALLQELIRIPSVNPPGGEAPIAELLARRGEALGFEPRLAEVRPGRPNLVIDLAGTGERPGVLLSGHSDVVPPGELAWEHAPFSADLVDGEVWGRGATDMKSGVAAMFTALAAIRRRGWRPAGDIRLAITVGEEVDCVGAMQLRDTGGLDGVGWIVIGEPTNLDVVAAHRGAIWLQIVGQGKTAHGSMPHLGVNAILPVVELLRWIGERWAKTPFTPHPLLAPPTMNVGTIAGGVKTNVVPDRCVATVDLRTLPGQDHAAILQGVRDLAAEMESTVPGLRLDITAGNDMPPVETPVDHPLIRATAAAVAEVVGVEPRVRGATYFTDGGMWVTSGIPMVIFGPGDDTLAHQPNERVPVEQVVAATRGYLALLERLLG